MRVHPPPPLPTLFRDLCRPLGLCRRTAASPSASLTLRPWCSSCDQGHHSARQHRHGHTGVQARARAHGARRARFAPPPPAAPPAHNRVCLWAYCRATGTGTSSGRGSDARGPCVCGRRGPPPPPYAHTPPPPRPTLFRDLCGHLGVRRRTAASPSASVTWYLWCSSCASRR